MYSPEAVEIAARILGGAGVRSGGKGGRMLVSVVSSDPEASFRELMNEALNQQCRLDLLKRTGKISELILANALLSALGVRR